MHLSQRWKGRGLSFGDADSSYTLATASLYRHAWAISNSSTHLYADTDLATRADSYPLPSGNTNTTAIALYFAYFDTHASGISIAVCSGKWITKGFYT